MRIVEYRILLPMTVDEYKIGQLYSVAEASKNETGGGDGIEVLVNEPFDKSPDPVLYDGSYTTGQYTHKIYHLQNKVPGFIRMMAPTGSLQFEEKAWNAYPYCRTVIENLYMKNKFYLKIETMHKQDNGTTENAHGLTPEQLRVREIVHIDIADNSVLSSSEYKPDEDPTKFHSEKTGRGPLDPRWREHTEPMMCCYKLISYEFSVFGFQTTVESFIKKSETRIFRNFHRQLFCWIDKWHGMTMEDIRRLEDKTKEDLDQERVKGEIRGTVVDN